MNAIKNLLNSIHGEQNPKNELTNIVSNCDEIIKELEDLIHKEEKAQHWSAKTSTLWHQPKANVSKELEEEAAKARKNIEYFHKVCPELKNKLKEIEHRLKRLGVSASNILNASSKRTRKQRKNPKSAYGGYKKKTRRNRRNRR